MRETVRFCPFYGGLFCTQFSFLSDAYYFDVVVIRLSHINKVQCGLLFHTGILLIGQLFVIFFIVREPSNYEMQIKNRESSIRVQVLLFASLREITGRERLEVELSPPGNNIECALKIVCESYSHLQELLVTEQISVALNQKYLSRTDFSGCLLNDGDIIALLPPISGG